MRIQKNTEENNRFSNEEFVSGGPKPVPKKLFHLIRKKLLKQSKELSFIF